MKGKRTQKQNIFGALFGEMTEAKASGWSYALLAIAITVASFVFLVALGAVGVNAEEAKTTDWYLYCSYLVSPVAFGCTVWAVLAMTKIPLQTELKAQKCKGKYFLLAVLLQVGLLSLSELNLLFLEFLSMFGYENAGISIPSLNGMGFVGVLFVVAVLPEFVLPYLQPEKVPMLFFWKKADALAVHLQRVQFVRFWMDRIKAES